MKKLLAVLLTAVIAMAFASCGSTDYSGDYSADRATVHVEMDGDDSANIEVRWGKSAKEDSEWVMSGTLDADTGTFEYHDCVKTDFVYKENGDVESEEEVYVGGHGFMFFKDGDPLSVTWQDDQEHVADDIVFTYVR